MSSKDLKAVIRQAVAARVGLTHERFSYFHHVVHIGYTVKSEMLTPIDRLKCWLSEKSLEKFGPKKLLLILVILSLFPMYD